MGERHPARPADTSVTTHVLDTSLGRPATSVGVELSTRSSPDAAWTAHARALTDADGRCTGLPALPVGTAQARLRFDVGPHLAATPATGGAFFPEVAVAFAVVPGEHYHVPLLLNPFGYSVYRGS
ncbi:hydroxyisourate hydrolase [Streptomyces sp. NPDC057702]|uniref:hydroxyisourate hydrolase n=1 Tax=unclassified Streptomyces TaxID=2593676 RepID=UPI003678C419